MSDELTALENKLSGIIATVEPPARRKLAREIGARLRKSQALRIAAQQNPDGTPFAKRSVGDLSKIRSGVFRALILWRIKQRQRAMFRKIRTTKFMRVEATSDAAVLTFANSVQHMARVHQYGLRDKVEHKSCAPIAKYPARQLFGFKKEERKMVENAIIDHIQNG